MMIPAANDLLCTAVYRPLTWRISQNCKQKEITCLKQETFNMLKKDVLLFSTESPWTSTFFPQKVTAYHLNAATIHFCSVLLMCSCQMPQLCPVSFPCIKYIYIYIYGFMIANDKEPCFLRHSVLQLVTVFIMTVPCVLSGVNKV